MCLRTGIDPDHPARDVEASIDGDWQDVVLIFIRQNQGWGFLIVFLLAFGESLAFISLLLPATAILFGVGGLIGAAGIAFWPIWLAAVIGAVLGDWVSSWLGYHYQHSIAEIWPLSRHAGLLARGERLFRRWGVFAILVGRFFGPLRSVVPLVAGVCRMSALPFQIANVVSALIWSTGILSPGTLAVRWLL